MRNDEIDVNSFRYSGLKLCSTLANYYKIDCNGNNTCEFGKIAPKYFSLNKKVKVSENFLDDGMFITQNKQVFFCENPRSSDGSARMFITIDVNGVEASPNVLGRDVYAFWVDFNGALKPMGSDGSPFSAKSYCNIKNTWVPDSLQGFGCAYNAINDIKY